MNTDILVGLVSMALGVFSSSAAAFNWDWYFKLQKSRWLVSLCGRTGARVFYAILGLGLIVLGAALAAGIVGNKSTASNDLDLHTAPRFSAFAWRG